MAAIVATHYGIALVIAQRHRATAPIAALAGFEDCAPRRMVVAFGLLEKSNKNRDFGLIFDFDVGTHSYSEV
jgi:hypothetical protein